MYIVHEYSENLDNLLSCLPAKHSTLDRQAVWLAKILKTIHSWGSWYTPSSNIMNEYLYKSMSQLGTSTHWSVLQFPRRHAVTDEWEHVISIPLEIFRRINCARFSTSGRCRCSLRVEEVFPTPHFLHFNTWRLIQSLEKKWSLKLSNIFLDTCDIQLSTKTSVRDGKNAQKKKYLFWCLTILRVKYICWNVCGPCWPRLKWTKN